MRILVVEDEARLAGLLERSLEEEGHAVDVAGSGEEALDWVHAAAYEAIVLDVMLPGIDGLEVCRRLRAARVRTPILLLTARDAIADRVAGLDAGADDYLVKPFAFAELLARLRALARRPVETHETVLRAGDLALDPAARRVCRGEREIALSNKEFRILEVLLRHRGQVVTRDMIAERVWDYDFPNATNVIDVHLRALRRKLDDPYPGTLIQTVRGAGYRLSGGGGGTGGGGDEGTEEAGTFGGKG
jgi:DNA-binding response OmpR family regulator